MEVFSNSIWLFSGTTI